MTEFLIFWTVVSFLFIAAIYVSYQHYMICKIRRQVNNDWNEILQTVDKLDDKLKQIQDSISQTENRVEKTRQDQITTIREADHISFSVHQSIEDLVKNQKPSPLNITVDANDYLNVTNSLSNKKKKVAKMSSNKKKSQ